MPAGEYGEQVKLTAKHNNVVVLVDKDKEHTHATGLAITAQTNVGERNPYGVIVSIGPDCRVPEFQIGTHVLIPPVGGTEVQDNLDTYIILLDHEIYGVISD